MEIDEPVYTIGKVARLTGVKIPTIRSWEDTIGLPHPSRSKGRFRLYSARDVEIVRMLRQRILVEKIPPRLVSLLEPSAALSTSANGSPANGEARENLSGREQPTSASGAGEEVARPQPRDPSEHVSARLRSLYRLSAAVSSSLELDQVLQQALTLIGAMFDAETTVILLTEEGARRTSTPFRKVTQGVLGSHRPTELDDLLYRQAAEAQAGITVADTETSPILAAAAREWSIRSVVALPLHYASKVEGVLCLAGATPRAFSPEEVILASLAAAAVAAAVANARLRLQARTAEQRYRGLTESSNDLIVYIGKEDEFTFLSAQVTAMLAYEPFELLGKPFLHIAAPESRDAITNHLRLAAQDEGQQGTSEVSLVRKDGGLVRVQLRVTPVLVDGLMVTSQGIIRDISETIRLERDLLQRSKELSVIESVAAVLSRSLELGEVMQMALDRVVELMGMEIGLLSLLDEEKGELVLKVHRGAPPDLLEQVHTIKLGTGIAGRVAATGEPIHVDDMVEDDPRRIVSASTRPRHRSYVCVPLTSKSGVLGTMSLTGGSLRTISTEDVRLLSSIGSLVGGAIENARLHEQSTRSHNDRLIMMQEKLSQVTEAQREERRRLARELHDDVIQSVAALVAELETRKTRGGVLPMADIDRGQKILQDVLGSTRRLLMDLRGPLLEGKSLPLMLEEVLPRQVESLGFAVELHVQSWPEEVPRDVTFHLYRIVQEALANVRKHAKARRVDISLRCDEHHVEAEIRDDGIGFEKEKLVQIQEHAVSFGIAGMRERASLLGGQLAVDSAAMAGTSVTVTVPRYWEQDLGQELVRVLIVDDHALFSQALASLLGTQEHIQVVGIAPTGQEALQMARRLSLDVIMMDINLPDMSGIEVTRAIRAENPDARIVLLTAYDKEHNVLEGLRAGATAFVSKTCSPAELVQSVFSALKGEHTISPRVASQVLELMSQSPERSEIKGPLTGLTAREIETLKMLAAGRPSKEIARLLNITDKTVRRHISNIYQKLQVYDRAQLVLFAVKQGLIEVKRET